MKVMELVSKTYGELILYKADSDMEEGYIDIFKGKKADIPTAIMKMEVRVFGSKKKGVLDIEVKTE